MIKLLDLLIKLDDLFDIAIKNDNTLLYNGVVEDIPLSLLKEYCYWNNYVVQSILTDKVGNMIILIDEEEN